MANEKLHIEMSYKERALRGTVHRNGWSNDVSAEVSEFNTDHPLRELRATMEARYLNDGTLFMAVQVIRGSERVLYWDTNAGPGGAPVGGSWGYKPLGRGADPAGPPDVGVPTDFLPAVGSGVVGWPDVTPRAGVDPGSVDGRRRGAAWLAGEQHRAARKLDMLASGDVNNPEVSPARWGNWDASDWDAAAAMYDRLGSAGGPDAPAGSAAGLEWGFSR